MSIIRIVHNKDNPFVQLNKGALWDPRLSLTAVGLWVRCMSRPDNWKFSIKELLEHCKEGRHTIDKAMRELIDANYVVRLKYSNPDEKGRYKKDSGGVEYVFFEFPATEEEKIEQLEIFKKSFRRCDFRDTGFRDLGNQHLLIKNKNKKERKDIEPPLSPPAPDRSLAPLASEPPGSSEKDFPEIEEVPKKPPKGVADYPTEVQEVAAQLIKILKDDKPNYAAPKNLAPVCKAIDAMIRLDKRTPEGILANARKTLLDAFWGPQIFSGNPGLFLRKRFDQIEKSGQIFDSKKSTPTSNLNLVKKHFKHGGHYNGAECFITQDSIAFQRGMTHKQIKFKEFGFIDQLDAILRSFGIYVHVK